MLSLSGIGKLAEADSNCSNVALDYGCNCNTRRMRNTWKTAQDFKMYSHDCNFRMQSQYETMQTEQRRVKICRA